LYPSNHIDAYRALDNPKFIFVEADFFRKGEQEDVRHVSERYIAKSDPYIVMVSTPVSDKDIEEFLALGAKAILRKPLSIQELQDTIDKFR
jgi:CheY-like chemotaxis protein